MKKIIVGGISFLCCFLMFAEKNLYGKENCERVIPKIQTLSSDLEDSKNELGDSIKNFTETANEMGSGSGFFGVTFDPLGTQNLMCTANFSLIGVWGAEISVGYSLRKAFAIEVDPLNFVRQFPVGEKMAWSIGVGCPLIFTLGSDNDIFGIKPRADLRFHFFANHEYGLSFFVRPGYIVDFNDGKRNNAFSCAVGIMCRLPSSIIAEAFASVF